MDAELFKKDPRDYALKMVEDGLVSADQMLLCALKYMSHDDVRGMLDANELSPRFDESEPDFDQYDADEYDVEAMKTDHSNGNFDDTDADDYRHENIVAASILNGQFSQAREQCKRFGLNYEEEKRKAHL